MGVYKKILIEANFEIKLAKIIEKRLCRKANKVVQHKLRATINNLTVNTQALNSLFASQNKNKSSILKL